MGTQAKEINDFSWGPGDPQHATGVARGVAAAAAAPQAHATSGAGGKEGTQRPVISRNNLRPSFSRVRWYPLLRLDLAEGLVYDTLEYTGTERTRRQSSRSAVNPSSKADFTVGANLAVVDPSGNAASSTLGQTTDRMASYTSKLRTLVRRLEEVVAPPDEVVRGFWDQLDAAERTRFCSEFPQCMAYIAGWHSAM